MWKRRQVMRITKTVYPVLIVVSASLLIMMLLPYSADAQPALNRPAVGHGPLFVDEDGDGYRDNAPDHDGDGIPNGRDPDYKRPLDGSGRLAGQAAQSTGQAGQGRGNGGRGRGRNAGITTTQNISGAGQGSGTVTSAAGNGLGGGQRLRDGSGIGGQFGPGTCPGTGSRGRTVTPGTNPDTGTTPDK